MPQGGMLQPHQIRVYYKLILQSIARQSVASNYFLNVVLDLSFQVRHIKCNFLQLFVSFQIMRLIWFIFSVSCAYEWKYDKEKAEDRLTQLFTYTTAHEREFRNNRRILKTNHGR